MSPFKVITLLSAAIFIIGTEPRSQRVFATGRDNPIITTPFPKALKPFISEVAPAAAPDKPAWIELAVESQGSQVFVPLVARDASSAIGAMATTSHMQLVAPAMVGADLRGHVIDGEGFAYTFPEALPLVPPGGIIVVELGTPGPDDLDFSDGVATLHAGLVPTQAFASRGGSVGLYNSRTLTASTMLDFVAWGNGSPARGDLAAVAGLWPDGASLQYDPGLGGESALQTPRQPNASFGLYAGEWASYRTGHSSRGKPNPPPPPMATLVADGEVMDAATADFRWLPAPGATGYEFELATTPDFSSPLIRAVTPSPGWRPSSQLADGAYYWRVHTIGQNGAKSDTFGPFMNTLMTPSLPIAQKTLMNQSHYRIQRKDTTMLDIGGGPGNKPGKGSLRFGTRDRWDGPHVNNDTDKFPTFSWNGFDNLMCVRASVAMLAAFYGGNLSIDRISYFIFEENASADYPSKGTPEGDLGFGKGASSSAALPWALNAETESASYCPKPAENEEDEDYRCHSADPTTAPVTITFGTIQSMIDSGRPFLFSSGKHAQVVDGYLIDANHKQWIRVFNPVPIGADECVPGECTGISWKLFDDFKVYIVSTRVVKLGETVNARNDEASLKQDSDLDGINNFDETVRFTTDPNNTDSDNDSVLDKSDIAEYVFNAADTYAKRSGDLGLYLSFPNGEPHYSYPDLDVQRKELDWDHDGDGIPDGCEDRDRDGRLEAGDTDNFNPTSQQPCVPILFIDSPTTDLPANVGSTVSPGLFLIGLGAYVPEGMMPKPTYTPDHFEVKVGTKTATVLNIIKVGDFTHEMLVQAPAQLTPGKYDLTVSFYFGDETTNRTDAVQYESPPVGVP
jgi:hypothetical protein